MTDPDAQFTLLKHLVAAAFAHDKPDHIGVAVSGGGDSMALLRLLAEWGERENVKISAVTVDHGLREGSAQEADFVGQTCAALKVQHTTVKWTGWAGAGNLQDAARRARYGLMARWAEQEGVSTIALGHTADDQAETFFMRLARASGIDGLSGMQRRRTDNGVTWVRPLLMQEREELRQFLRSLHQPWIEDPSNDDETFDRIKARKAMEALTDLGIDAHVVGRVMDHLSQVRSTLDVATYELADGCMQESNGDLLIDRSMFLAAPPELNRRLVSHCLRWIASADYAPRGMKLQHFISSMRSGKHATLHGVRLIGGAQTLRLTREFGAVAGENGIAGALWDKRWRINIEQDNDFIVRALGDDGLAQLGVLEVSNAPRESLKSTPAVFDGDVLVAAPVVNLPEDHPLYGVKVCASLVHPPRHAFTSLLSH